MDIELKFHALVAGDGPDVSFGLTSTDRNVDLVAEGFDIAIRAGRLADSTLKSKKFAEVVRRLCASPRYLATAPALNHPRDIVNHSSLTLRRTPGYSLWRFSDGEEIFEVRASGQFTANSGNMLVTAACHGRGLMLSPEWILGAPIASGALVPLLPKFCPYPATTPLYAVHPYQRFVPPKVKVFIAFLSEHFGESYNWAVHPISCVA